MRILEVCSSEALGGLELYFLKCCEKLHTLKESELMALIKNQSLIDDKLDRSIKSQKLNRNSIIARVSLLNRYIKEFQPDIIHSHVKTDLLPIALCKLLNQRKFIHVHTRQMNMPGRKKNFYHNFIYRQIDLLITITKRLRTQVLENVNIHPDKTRVLYYGVPEASGHKAQIPAMEKDEGFKIGLIARIDPGKNQRILLEALKILNGKGFKASAYLVGGSTDEVYANQLKALIFQYGLKDQVQMTGFVKDPINLMPDFDIILLTSPEETFGLVLAEAMRAGVAVIGADGGGVPEIIEHGKTGLLFKPNDPESLAHQLKKVMTDRGLLKMLAQAGKKRADEKFNEEKHFDTLHQIFRQLIS